MGAMLLDIDKEEAHGPEIGLGDEGDHPWMPILIPWNGPHALTQDTLLEKLGAHEQLRAKRAICTLPGYWNDPLEEGSRNIRVWLDKFPGKDSLYFHTGSDLLNPVIVFAVVRVRPHLVAGFMGGIVHT